MVKPTKARYCESRTSTQPTVTAERLTPGETVTVVMAVFLTEALNEGYEPAFRHTVPPLATDDRALLMLAPELSVVSQAAKATCSPKLNRIDRTAFMYRLPWIKGD